MADKPYPATDREALLERLLKLVQTDPGNWLHSDLQKEIELAVGPDGPYRSIDDSGLDAGKETPIT